MWWKISRRRIFIFKVGEYSTIDSAIMVAGAYFAGNYFGGELATLASSIGNTPQIGVIFLFYLIKNFLY